jgi:quinolinate synthase
VEKIREMKERKRAVILAHNYQPPQIQDLADFVGDSLGLAITCTKVESDLIVFCGVDFMAETASILNPDKKVLIPEPRATCQLAAQLPVELILDAKRKHRGAATVLYVNTRAEAKAEADAICTSANGAEVVNALEEETVIFGPDRNLAWFVQRRSGKRVIPIPADGHCYVHRMFKAEDIRRLKDRYPGAEILAHPECDPEVQEMATAVCSTSQMLKWVRRSGAKEFIIATEVGMLYRLRRENPGRVFIPALPEAVCGAMKMHTLEKLYLCLRDERPEVRVGGRVAERARRAIERMFELTRARQD